MQLETLGPGGGYHTRLLRPPDLRSLQALFERATDYFEVATGQPPAADEAARAYVAGPPSKQVTDKRTIGIFTGNDALVGVLDALTDWPDAGTWTMGMLLLDPAHRGKGLGRASLTAYEAWAHSQGATRFHTAIVAHHEPGIRFITLAGYEQLRRVEPPPGSASAIVFFEKKEAS